MKIMALYLPQYHQIPENDEWWGRGFTEWTTVKNAKKFYEKHNQPKVPIDDNYYDLVKYGVETWSWQAELMKKYNIDGLCIYHYWFNGKMLLEKPMEILLGNKKIDIKYCICWANETWSRNWSGESKKILMEQTYGGVQDEIAHFKYLLPFFKDDRYIKINNKPMVNLYKSKNIPNLKRMILEWNALAKKNGFDGIYWVSAITAEGNDNRKELFDHYYYFEPGYTLRHDLLKLERAIYLAKGACKHVYNQLFSKKKVERMVKSELVWRRIEKRKTSSIVSPGTFVSWDNTPRRSERGTIFLESTPKRFGENIRVLKEKYEDGEYIYINAWNEWGEGAYLEPDKEFGYKYLEEIRKAMG